MDDLPEHAAHARYRAEQAAPAVKVKPLVWRMAENRRGLEADGLGCQYHVPRGEPDRRKRCEADHDARILAAVEAIPAAEVWSRAIEAAAGIVKNTPEWKFGNLWHRRDIENNVRALPMPDDLK